MINKSKLKKIIAGGVICAIAVGLIFTSAFADSVGQSIKVFYNNIKIVMDGKQVDPTDANGKSVKPFVFDGTTYLPVRAVAKVLGVDVTWDGLTGTIYLGKVSYKDGTYKAAYNKLDSHGWKGQVELTIKDNKITACTFDYVNKDGALKSKDEGYNSAMLKASKTNPAEFSVKLPQSLLDKQKVDAVDTVTGATHSTQDFKSLVAAALANAVKGDTSTAIVALPEETSTTAAPTATAVAASNGSIKVYQGSGNSKNFRNGPGKDSENVPVYSFNFVTADAIFDKDGKIISLNVDTLEVSTPNYDGESMPHFSGWPGIQGYNVTDHKTEKVSGVSTNTLESATEEVKAWKTKRERGDTYHMNDKNDWYKQMDYYQKLFTGKTIAEIEQWYAKYCSDVNGRPLKATSTNEKDKAKLATLTDKEKADLVDVVTGASFSLSDAHGNIIAAIKDAYEKRVEVTIPVK